MNLINRLCLSGLVLLNGSVAIAEDDRSGFYLNLGVGIEDFDSDRRLDDDTTYLLGGEYRFGEHWATELRYYYTDVAADLGSDVDVDQYGLDGLYYFPIADSALEPYLAAGIGYAVFDNGSDDMDEAQLNAGGGVRFYMSERFSLRADVRGIYGEDDDSLDTLASVGISYFFGQGGQKQQPEKDSDGDGVVDSLDQCPNTPQGVEVDEVGCPLDSDGDGVPDYMDDCPNTPAGTEVDEQGCPLLVSKTVNHTLDVKFEHNSAKLTPDSQAEIGRLAAFLTKYGTAEAVIEGHTDSSGSDAYNLKISQQRADAVKQSLVDDHNIDTARLTAVGKGEADPIASNDTDAGRDQNRRVVVVIEAQTAQ